MLDANRTRSGRFGKNTFTTDRDHAPRRAASATAHLEVSGRLNWTARSPGKTTSRAIRPAAGAADLKAARQTLLMRAMGCRVPLLRSQSADVRGAPRFSARV
jgi:hypothetical protein